MGVESSICSSTTCGTYGLPVLEALYVAPLHVAYTGYMWLVQAACGTYRLPVLEVAACMYRRALFVAPPHVAHTCYLSYIYLSPPRHGDGKRGRAKEREVGDVGRTTMRHGMEKT